MADFSQPKESKIRVFPYQKDIESPSLSTEMTSQENTVSFTTHQVESFGMAKLLSNQTTKESKPFFFQKIT